MNEHDSERLAGILVADGLEPAEIREDADVVVFNTCGIKALSSYQFVNSKYYPYPFILLH